jgi:hypothetical protein
MLGVYGIVMVFEYPKLDDGEIDAEWEPATGGPPKLVKGESKLASESLGRAAIVNVLPEPKLSEIHAGRLTDGVFDSINALTALLKDATKR